MVHPWCQNVERDEAVRAAENAAAKGRPTLPDHRDLPERVARLEAIVTETIVEKLGKFVAWLERDQSEPVAVRVANGRWFPKSTKADPPPPPPPPPPLPPGVIPPPLLTMREWEALEWFSDCDGNETTKEHSATIRRLLARSGGTR